MIRNIEMAMINDYLTYTHTAAPFSILHSPFSILHSPFSILHYSPEFTWPQHSYPALKPGPEFRQEVAQSVRVQNVPDRRAVDRERPARKSHHRDWVAVNVVVLHLAPRLLCEAVVGECEEPREISRAPAPALKTMAELVRGDRTATLAATMPQRVWPVMCTA